MDPNDVVSRRLDWEFHQATGMVAAQLDLHDMDLAAHYLALAADQCGESLHDTALVIVDRRGRLRRGAEGVSLVPSGR